MNLLLTTYQAECMCRPGLLSEARKMKTGFNGPCTTSGHIQITLTETEQCVWPLFGPNERQTIENNN
jgi:hypothetical protein